ncbi:hypothetical protein JOQ06_010919 [Pogonophryne albipinna]|uniref:Uncharacterized protein n=1 Tax=Pogonophryne albipinna TaxID=1090488 RepID=A0AAD6FG78_9TELE|nr:hypothetical protein JOQ06_010919 [Pogonophryne albipinna]
MQKQDCLAFLPSVQTSTHTDRQSCCWGDHQAHNYYKIIRDAGAEDILADGNHNGVSPDMLLEQTYNADAKEASGLDGITLNRAARMKWVYTKPLTAAISAELKSTLHLHSSSPHHESGWSHVKRDAEMVVKVMAAVETNPFTTATPSLINISTGECADPTVKDNLSVKAVGLKALSESLSSDQKKTSVEDGRMRTGTKADLVKILKEKTKVSSIPDLPKDCLKTTVVVDAMSAIRHWSFHRGEGFGVIAEQYRHLLLIDVPPGNDIIHFCCDKYSTTSLKSAAQEQRYARSKPAKVYEVSEQYTALDPNKFVAVSANKANLLSFLCEKWCADEQLEPGLGPTHLYLGGGFKEETKIVVLTACLSGRDTTSYPYFTGKRAWFKSSISLDIPALEEFGENPADAITDDLLNQARDLTITVSKADHFEGSDLGKLRAYKFLNNKLTLLKLLPPT